MYRFIIFYIFIADVVYCGKILDRIYKNGVGSKVFLNIFDNGISSKDELHPNSNQNCLDYAFPPPDYPLRENYHDILLETTIFSNGGHLQKTKNQWYESGIGTNRIFYAYKNPDYAITHVAVEHLMDDIAGYGGEYDEICVKVLEGGSGSDHVLIYLWGNYELDIRISLYGVHKDLPEWNAFSWFAELKLASKEVRSCKNIERDIIKQGTIGRVSIEPPPLSAKDFIGNDIYFTKLKNNRTRFHYMYEYLARDKTNMIGVEVLNHGSSQGCASIRQGGVGQNYVRIYSWADENDERKLEDLRLPQIALKFEKSPLY